MADQAPASATPLMKLGLWGVISQGLNSAGNVALAIMVARQSSVNEFGAWSTAYIGYLLALSVVRALANDPQILNSDQAARREVDAPGALSLVAWISLVTSLAMCLVAVFVPPVRAAFLAFACVAPFALLQDSYRYVFFARRAPFSAARVDFIWTGAQALGFSSLALLPAGILAPTLIWGAGAAMAAAWAALATGELPRARAAIRFARDNRWAGRNLLADAGLLAVSTNAVFLVLIATDGLASVGALRAGLTLMGGLSLLVFGLTPVATVESIRALRSGRSEAYILVTWTLTLTVLGAAYGLPLLILPDPWGDALLGETWTSVAPFLLALVLQGIVRGPFTGAQIVLRARYSLDSALRLRLWTSVPNILFPVLGCLVAGVAGAAWGIFAGTMAANLISVTSILRRRATAPSVTPARKASAQET